MNNPINFIKNALRGNLSPQNIVGNIVPGNNQILQNLVNLANKGDQKAIENFAKNYFKENGRDFEKEFGAFMKNFK